WVLIAQNKFEEALQEAEKEPHEFWRLFPKACILFALGNNKQADDLLAQLLEQYGDSQPSYISYVYAFRKENDKAFKWLEIAFERRDPNLIEEINFIGVYRELNDPRLDTFLTKMGLPKDHWLFTAATHKQNNQK
ncbi:MAG: hypothetical protein KAU21_14305, partial [Gammaproteobacteria bacterium]|nr:hypothetical protein [Gammaproteobacteria bacterium]